MNKILSLAIKDLRVLISDRGNVFWVFGFPVIFALFFGAIYSSAGEGPSGMEIAIVNEDNSEFSNSYISKLQSDEQLKIANMSRQEAIEQVRKGKVAAAVILNKGFGDGFEALFSSENPKLEIASDPSRRMESGYLQGLLAKAQFEALSEKFADRQWMKDQVALWRGELETANDLDFEDAELYLKFMDSLDTLLTDANDESFGAGFDGEILNFAKMDINREYEGPITAFQVIYPQAMLWGILGCTATFAISIVKERTNGTFNRLRIGPLSRAHILAGKGTACFMTCVFLICILSIGAKVIFKTPISNFLLFIPAAVCTLLCFVGLMMFICTLGRTEQSAGGAGWAIIMIMAMIGGGMVPLAFMPSWLRPFSHISPVKWSIYALEGAIWRDFSFRDLINPCLVLLAIGFVAFLLGVFMLRRQDD
ncbi:MAG: ABC transporter permease [Planctomycetota bacterium]|jgi:ABC-2 type transport system permease protein